jgi:hypothetical protein
VEGIVTSCWSQGTEAIAEMLRKAPKMESKARTSFFFNLSLEFDIQICANAYNKIKTVPVKIKTVITKIKAMMTAANSGTLSSTPLRTSLSLFLCT